MFVGTLVVTPVLVARMPADYFVKPHYRGWPTAHPALRIAWLVIKNILGVLLAVAGLAMLLLPGQGLITLLLGVMLLDFPGKHRFELWLVSRRSIYRATTWIRNRKGKQPLLLPDKIAPKPDEPKHEAKS